jgi:hypothetical protein
MKQFLQFLFILLIGYFLVCNMSIWNGETGWWRAEIPAISNWRNTPNVQWSSNPYVYRYYHNWDSVGALRRDHQKEIEDRLRAGDTLTVGLDYYSYYDVGGWLLDRETKNMCAPNWAAGRVLCGKMWAFQGKLYIFDAHWYN